MKLIPNWQDKKLVCHFCHTLKSVKYTVEIPELIFYGNRIDDNRIKYIEVPACNKCALICESRK